MPTITLPPVQVDLVNYARQSQTEINPFEFKVSDAAIYQLLCINQFGLGPRIAIYKSTDKGVTWVEKDAANSPDNGSATGALVGFQETGFIDVSYVVSSAWKIAQFNTSTDTWGTPSAASGETINQNWWFYRKSNGDYVIVYSDGNLKYITYSAGSWNAAVSLGAYSGSVRGGVRDGVDAAHLVLISLSGNAEYVRLDAAFTIGSVHTFPHGWYNVTNNPTICLYGADSIAYGWAPLTGTSFVDVSIGTPLAAPAFTNYEVFTAPDANEIDSFITVKEGGGNVLNVFWCRVNVTTDPLIDEIDQSIFDGVSAWGVNTTFYDEITNSAPNSIAQSDQFVHTLDLAQFDDGKWGGATAMETTDGVDQFCTGFALDPEGEVPTQTLELTKIVSGGPAVPGDFFLSAMTGSPETGISGNGHVGPDVVAPGTYELSETDNSGAKWGDATWGDETWGGTYIPGPWNCGDAEMPTPTSVVVPEGGSVSCSITNTFQGPTPPPPPGPGEATPVGCFELLRIDVTLTPAKHLPTRGSTR